MHTFLVQDHVRWSHKIGVIPSYATRSVYVKINNRIYLVLVRVSRPAKTTSISFGRTIQFCGHGGVFIEPGDEMALYRLIPLRERERKRESRVY